MKQLLSVVLAWCFALLAQAQAPGSCPNINDLSSSYVCGPYGDAAGNANWNWEVTRDNPDYCKYWYANTSDGRVISLRSPFQEPSSTKLQAIASSLDYQKANGWELVVRNFGCSGPITNPYFVLYNKYTGLMRVYVYVNGTESFSQILVEVTSNRSLRPGVMALGNELLLAPDKYVTGSAGGAERLVSVSESAGSNRWSVADFNTTFDPNVFNPVYDGAALQVTVYGVVNSTIQAKITGTSVTTATPQDYAYAGSGPATQNGSNFDFKATGQKLMSLGSNLGELQGKINATATNIVSKIPAGTAGALGKVRVRAEQVQALTNAGSKFGQVLGSISEVLKGASGVFSIVGTVVGLFSKRNAAASTPGPMYSSYNLTLEGTISTQKLVNQFVILTSGAPHTDPLKRNAAYYNCPLGIFNIKNTPAVDKIDFAWQVGNQVSLIDTTRKFGVYKGYTSYRLANNIAYSYNYLAGLELVSVQAALLARVPINSNTGRAQYDLFNDHSNKEVNYMLIDLEANRTEVAQFDANAGLHVVQTPYVNIECFNNTALTVKTGTPVFVRIKAVLKKAGSDDESPILWINDYAVDINQQPSGGIKRLYEMPPYANYQSLPATNKSNVTVSARLRWDYEYLTEATSRITASNVSLLPLPYVFKAGGEVVLRPEFHVPRGSTFTATTNYGYGFNQYCTSPQADPFAASNSCYNTGVQAGRTVTSTPKADEASNGRTQSAKDGLTIYPVPSGGVFNLRAPTMRNAQVLVSDTRGVPLQTLRLGNTDYHQLDLHKLPAGIYLLRFSTPQQTLVRRVEIVK